MAAVTERRKALGQFWTPAWVAEAMTAYVAKQTDLVFDPAVGKGAFYTGLKKNFPSKMFYGTDIDPVVIEEARREGIFDDYAEVEINDFIVNPPQGKFMGIVGNPPYIRHHLVLPQQKEKLQAISLRNLKCTIDGRASLHVYFLIQALELLARDGRLAFIIPADTFEGVFSEKLWGWVATRFRIDGIVTFERDVTPFPGLDINAVIVLITNTEPEKTLKWVQCRSTGTELFDTLNNDFSYKGDGCIVCDRDLAEALSSGLSRPPKRTPDSEFTLGDFASVVIGIATGANDFFFLTNDRVKELGIPDQFLLPCVGRTRDVDDRITDETLRQLDLKGRPTRLLSLSAAELSSLPETVQSYIRTGEDRGLHERALISTRYPWFKMEIRRPPSFLFAYLGKRDNRFIKNDANVVPLNCFLCVYPHSKDEQELDKLWKVLQHPDTNNALSRVGKCYGGGSIKVEPRSLERLPLPSNLLKRIGLTAELVH